MMTIRVPLRNRIFILEDSPERLCWFHDKLQSRVVGEAKTPERAIELLRYLDPNSLDLIFLDHDLGGPFKAPYATEVAEYLAGALKRDWSGLIVIHSHNQPGAQRMARILYHWKPYVQPFGYFDIIAGGT